MNQQGDAPTRLFFLSPAPSAQGLNNLLFFTLGCMFSMTDFREVNLYFVEEAVHRFTVPMRTDV